MCGPLCLTWPSCIAVKRKRSLVLEPLCTAYQYVTPGERSCTKQGFKQEYKEHTVTDSTSEQLAFNELMLCVSNLGSTLNYGRYLQNHLVYPVESIRISFGELAALSMLAHREPELRGSVQHNGGGVLRRRPHDNHLRWGVAVR